MPHIHELYDFVVTPFIVHEDKVLLVNHPRYNKWIPPGGHIELDEDPEEALYREIEEETGLEVKILSTKPSVDSPGIKPLPAPNYVEVHEANAPHKHIALIYFAVTKTDAFRLSGEHTAMKWFTLEELEEAEYALPPSTKFYAREAITLSKA